MRYKPLPHAHNLTGMHQFRRLLAFVRLYRGRLLLALAAILAHGLLGLAGPYTLHLLLDAVFQQDDPRLLDRLTLILIANSALHSAFYFGRRCLPLSASA